MAGDGASAARIKELRKKRGSLKSKLTNLKKFIDGVQAEPDLNQIASRKEQLLLDKATFDHLQSELDTLVDDEDAAAEYEQRDDYENTFYSYESKINRLLNTNFVPPTPALLNTSINPQTSDSSETPRGSGVGADMRAPTMHLPTFGGGQSEQWTTFSASFRISIHQNNAYSGTRKLLYLRTCLRDKALEKIESLDINDANYEVAWALLEEAYFDFNTVVQKLVQSFFNLPQCKKSCASELGTLIDESSRSYRALEALKKQYHHIFPMHAIISKLDEQTRLKWRENAISLENPQMYDLLKFLNNRRKILADTSSRDSKSDSNSQKGNLPKSNQVRSNNQSLTLTPNTRPPFCHLCKQAHYTYTCERLVNASPKERFNIVKSASLCLNCLRANHTVKECKVTSRCKSCGKNHHSLLHFETANNSPANGNNTNLTAVVESHVILSTAVVHLIDKQ